MLVTSRWISWRPMKGPTLGWLNSVSSAAFSAAGPDVPAATVVPRKVAASVEWRAALKAMGSSACCSPVTVLPLRLVGWFLLVS